jgi:hypothetical protein
MKNTKRGYSTTNTIIAGIIIILIIFAFYLALRPKPTIAPVTTNNQATSISHTLGTTTEPQTEVVTPDNPNIKTFADATLGFSIKYPREFLLKSQSYSSTGSWSALFSAYQGNIILTVVKGPLTTKDVRIQTETVKVGSKDATRYNTRRPNGCDATVAQTSLDTEYSLQIEFVSCGSADDAIYKNQAAIDASLASVQFTNDNTKLLVQPKQGFALRYPIQWASPVQTALTGSTKYTFGQDLELKVGADYSAALKRNLTLNEVVTGALTTPGTVSQKMMVDGKDGFLLTTTPTSGPTLRSLYVANKSTSDLVIITQKGVDAEGLNLVINSFAFIK